MSTPVDKAGDPNYLKADKYDSLDKDSELRAKVSQAISFAVQGVQELPTHQSIQDYYKQRDGWVEVETDQIMECDPCIADLIQALNVSGIKTVASCCGHGNRQGSILLADNREILLDVFKSYEAIQNIKQEVHHKAIKEVEEK